MDSNPAAYAAMSRSANKAKRANFWILLKLAFGALIMSYLVYLLKNKSHFMDKLFSPEFLDFLKHYKQIIITGIVLLSIKLFNKLCSLIWNIRNIDRGKVRITEYYLYGTRNIDLDYAKGNQNGISHFLAILIFPLPVVGPKLGDVTSRIGIKADYWLKKLLTLGAIALVTYSIVQSFRGVDSVFNIIPKDFRQNLAVMIPLIIALIIAITVFVYNRYVDGINWTKSNGEEYNRHVGRRIADFVLDDIPRIIGSRGACSSAE